MTSLYSIQEHYHTAFSLTDTPSSDGVVRVANLFTHYRDNATATAVERHASSYYMKKDGPIEIAPEYA